MEKANIEYQKYKELKKDEISEVEKHFLEQVNTTEKKLKDKNNMQVFGFTGIPIFADNAI